MKELLSIGQWQGFFKYGPEYGELLEGKEAEFRLFIETYNDGQFTGRVIDWDGVGAEGETAFINGFIKDNFISFTKQYSHLHIIDVWGETSAHTDMPGHTVFYEGNFDTETSSFYGSWQISIDIGQVGELSVEETTNGTWRMSQQE